MTNVNNLPTMVVGDPATPDGSVDPPVRRSSWLRRWWWVVAILSVTSLITAVVAAGLLIHVPYVIESPGSLYSTHDRITIEGAPKYDTNDRIDVVTVTVDTRVTALEKFIADRNTDDVVVPADEVLGGQTPAQNDQFNALLMSQSKDAAVLVALQKLGYDVKPTSTGAIVQETERGAPADGVVQIADTI